jgi:hypothetical protein
MQFQGSSDIGCFFILFLPIHINTPQIGFAEDTKNKLNLGSGLKKQN